MRVNVFSQAHVKMTLLTRSPEGCDFMVYTSI